MNKIVLMFCFGLVVFSFILFMGCSGKITGSAEKDSILAGAGGGALAGLAAGGNTESTLAGFGIGILGGWFVGDQIEQKQYEEQTKLSRMYGDDILTVWITNCKGVSVPVRLRRYQGGYIGPQGEKYESMPNNGQLQTRYGN